MSLGGHSLLHWHNHDWDVLLKGKINKYKSNALVFMMMQNLFYDKIMII